MLDKTRHPIYNGFLPSDRKCRGFYYRCTDKALADNRAIVRR